MLNDTSNGETQYCPMCEEWAISFNPFSDIINRDDFVKYVQSLFTEGKNEFKLCF